MTSFTRRAALAATLSLAATLARAADGPLKIIIPAGAGSGLDTQVRAAGPALGRALGGRAVVIENLAGAGGLTGTSTLVKAAPDGNTLAVVSNNHAVNPSVYKKMPYDTLADITPIAVIGETPFVLVVNPARVPARNAKELQAFLKARPGAYNYASSGNGTILHLAGEMVVDALGADVRHIPYKGAGPMVADIIGGQVEMGVVAVNVALPHLKSGALRAIGMTGKQRVPALPDLPTMAEQGFPDIEVGGWFAVVAPARLPPAEVQKLHAVFVATFNDPETRDAMTRQQNIINPMTPEASVQFFRSEVERYGRLARKADIKID
ncbi:Bug family tripartite tricarboxylate transporter substrate binding protein [Leptothrix sp. BB-4]